MLRYHSYLGTRSRPTVRRLCWVQRVDRLLLVKLPDTVLTALSRMTMLESISEMRVVFNIITIMPRQHPV